MFPYLKQALSNLFMKPSTIAFPAGDPPKAKENYRGRIAFNEKTCINCGMCERVCAPASITRKATKLENGDQEIDFSFDLTSCTFCGTCADFCATKSIILTDDYMMVGTTPEDFMVRATFIKKAPPKPKFTPEQLAEMKKKAEAAKAAKAAAAAAQKAE